jgi:glutamine synthetase adenylyltransferase
VDAEFLAQTLAMEGGWFEPNTLASLRRARDTGSLPTDDADLLIENFLRLRHMESILRRWSFEGEAVLPDDPAPQYRVAVRCGYSEAAAFFADLAQWRAAIRRVYAKLNPRRVCAIG